MSMISVLSLNVEGTKHIAKQLDFLQKNQPDVVCLQEIFACSIPTWESLGYHVFFQPYVEVIHQTRYPVQVLGSWGLAILTRLPLPVVNYEVRAYHGSLNQIPIFNHPLDANRVVQIITLEIGQTQYHLANTHFTWTPNGEANAEQATHLPRLLGALENYPQHVLMGDFNAPRGKETWQKLAERYQDNIPAKVTTTLDASLHYAGKLELVVDGIFSTPAYVVHDLQLHSGLSDHYGLSATVEMVGGVEKC